MMSGYASASGWLSGWNYNTPVIIDDSQNLSNSQIKINLQGNDPSAPGYVDFSKIRSDGADIRVTDSDGITQLPYWIESWDYNIKTATIWSKVSSTNSSIPSYFKFSTTSSAHNTYGLSYPVTYEFNIPSGSSNLNLKAYKKYNIGESWTQISEKTSNDFFNGIEAVRFDYPNNKAYVSAAFDANSNDIFLEIVDGNNNQVGTYNRIDKYYDNRTATVVASADDWTNGYNSDFSAACDMFRSKQIWFTPGIITNDGLDDPVSSSTWATIQNKINAGYMEPASHSRSHIYYTDSNYPGPLVDIDGSKQDILSNLNMINLDKRGSSQYLYAFIEPGGLSTSAMRTQLGLSKYLVDRSTVHPYYFDFTSNQTNPAIPTGLNFPTWDSTNGLYNRFEYSIRMGSGTIEGTGSDSISDVNVLNSAFDMAYHEHGIYHLMNHPWAVNWAAGQYADQHTTYISNKKDVWYVGLGDMFVYNYIRDQRASQYIPVSGKTIYVYYGNPNAVSLSNFSSVFIKDYSDSGYTGLWHMDEGAGTTTADSSGNGNTGTITGATWGANDGGQWGNRSDVAFQNGSYLQFNGVNNYVDFGKSNNLNFGNDAFSIEMWVNVTNESQRNPCIIDKSDDSDWTGPGTHQGYVLMNRDFDEGETRDDYNFMIGDGTSASHIPDSVPVGPLQNTGWNHIVITVDAGTAAYPQIKVYKNGAFLTSINRVNVGSVDTTNNLIVGKWSSRARYFTGSVDELREYNRVLSSDEVLAHYQRKSVTVSEGDVNVSNGSAQAVLPVANFTRNVTSGVVPLTVLFNDTSTNATDWHWDFGDNTISNERNTTHTFSTVGNYTVNLTVSNLYGTNSTTKNITVFAEVPPVANFTTNVTSGPVPLTALFNDTSINATAWYWNFGDNTTSNERNVTHTFSTVGTFKVNLTASNLIGTNSTTKNITVLPGIPPVANFTTNVTTGPAPLIVLFNDTSTNASTWHWDFGDNTISNERNVTHTFSTVGTYTVNLTASNLNGANSTTKNITVSPPIPVGNSTYAYISNSGNKTVTVVDTLTDKAVKNITVGNTPYGVAVSASGTRIYVANNNERTVSVIDGSTNTVISTISVGYGPYSLAVSPDGTRVYACNGGDNTVSVINTNTNTVISTVTVDAYPISAVVSNSGQKIYVTCYSGNKVSVIDALTNNKTKSISLGVEPWGITTNPAGTKVYVSCYSGSVYVIDTATDTASSPITVGSGPYGIACSPDGSKVLVANSGSNTVSFINTATNAVTTTGAIFNRPLGVSYTPDGTKAYVVNNGNNTLAEINPSNGAVVNITKVDTSPISLGQFILGQFIPPTVYDIPTANFTTNVTSGVAPLTVLFNDTSTNATAWYWNFGDNTTSNERNTTHTFSTVGNYTVNLTASNLNGTNSTTKNITVLPGVPLVANFTTNVTIGPAPLTVMFNDTSINATAWYWNFGDNTTSNERNTTHTFSTVGNYTVNLTASNLNGTNSTTKNITVLPGVPLVANFTTNVTIGPAPLTVMFNDTSINATAWYWNFGDNTTSNERNTTHTFSTVGNYTVNLTASNLNGTNSTTKNITVLPGVPLVANFTTNVTTGPAPLTVMFNDTSINATAWYWNFGDNTTSIERNTTHTFATVGNYTVNLTASNLNGTNSTTKNITVLPGIPPVANFSTNVTTGVAPLTVLFNDTSINATAWYWNFGDNTTSIERNTTHTFATVGNYTVNLTASNLNGANSTTKNITVLPGIPPVANFITNVTTGPAPLTVLFNDTSINATAWYWNFGDNTTSIERNTTHTFATVGNYTVNLTASNLNGANSTTKNITVLPGIPPVANFITNVTTGPAPLTVLFNDTSINATAWYWNFGDNTTSIERNTTHTFATVGNYTVNLTASNLNGTNSTTKNITVLPGIPPVANFITNVTTGVAPLTVLFNDTSINATAWYWDFGDNTTSIERNTTHTFATVGNYTVNLTASNLNGTNSTTKNITVLPGIPPVANFITNVTTGVAPLTVLFNDTSINATAWYWNFGDNTTSIERNTTHTFATVGNYTVNLTASNLNGTNSTTKNITALIFVRNSTYAYISNSGNKTVTVVDTLTDKAVKNITVGNTPYGVAVSASGTRIYVANNNERTVSVIDGSTNTVISTISVGYGPYSLAVSPDGTRVYACNGGDNTVSVINTNTNTVISTVTVDAYPISAVVSSSGQKIYVTCYSGNKVSVIDALTNNKTKSISLGVEPWGITTNPAGTKVYVSCYGGSVYVIDTATDTASSPITVGSGPYGIACSPDGSKVLVANSGSNTVSFINTATNAVTTTGAIFNRPLGVSYTPDGTKAYVVNNGNNTLAEINPSTGAVVNITKVDTSPISLGQFILGQFIPPTVYDIPTANFTSNVTSGVAPLTVLFNDTSTNATAWYWDFGDNTNSNVRNVTHTFLTNGTYTVNLTASNLNGTNSTAKDITVLGGVPPVANFTRNVTSGVAPLTVLFNDTSTNATAWYWDFGDNTNSNARNVTHTFSTNGTYTVNLTASNLNGTNSTAKDITVLEGILPVANFTSNVTSGVAPLTVLFNDTSTNATAWYWDFGDNTNSNSRNVTHTFSTIGTYTVNLTASNLNGTNSTAKDITVLEGVHR